MQTFRTNRIEMTDGGVLFEVVTPEGERIASCTNDAAAADLQAALGVTLALWEAVDPDRVVS